MTNIDTLLESYRAAATTERDKGTYFERLCAAFLTADPVQREQDAYIFANPNSFKYV